MPSLFLRAGAAAVAAALVHRLERGRGSRVAFAAAANRAMILNTSSGTSLRNAGRGSGSRRCFSTQARQRCAPTSAGARATSAALTDGIPPISFLVFSPLTK